MTRTLVAATLAIMFALCGSANASLISITAADDNDGAVDCTSTWKVVSEAPGEVASYDLNIDGVQAWGPGHILGDFIASSDEDPAVTAYISMDNDTNFDWTGYQVSVEMNKPFSLSNAGVDNPTDWALPTITQPTQVGSNYVGAITFSGGTPVTPAGTLDFHYKMTFAGSVSYKQTLTPVPEPATWALLGVGGLALLVWRRKR